MWRVGSKVPLNVYENERAVCQCHYPDDAANIVKAMNRMEKARVVGRKPTKLDKETIVGMYGAGSTFAEIVRKLELPIHPNTVRNRLAQWHVDRRPRGGNNNPTGKKSSR